MRSLKTWLMASAALACFGAAEPTSAQVYFPIYGAGATFPSVAYRSLFDCLYVPVDGNGNTNTPPFAIHPKCGAPSGNAVNYYAQILYAPVGSGSGRAAFLANNGGLVPSPSTTSIVPYVSSQQPTFPYPNYHFWASDDVVTQANVNALPAQYGRIIQLPSLAGAVTFAFNNNDGNGNPINDVGPDTVVHNTDPALGPTTPSSRLNLSRNLMCALVSGHLRKWDDSRLTALNGGTQLGTGNITFVHRFDSSGTSFIFTTAMREQCLDEFGPNNESDATLVSYRFPWTDRTVAASACGTTLLVPKGSNLVNWPDYPADQCGVAIPNPGGATFTQPTSNGNAAVIAVIQSTNGAIGYSSTDFVQPFVASGPRVANLQNEWDAKRKPQVSGIPARFFVAPDTYTTSQAMESLAPPPASAGVDAVAISQFGINQNPNGKDAYPIAGHTWLNFYSCYDAATNPNIGVHVRTLLYFLSGTDAQGILAAYGFVPPSGAWIQRAWWGQVDDPVYGLHLNNESGTDCYGKAGAK
ncbi:substrate-binding domain-containing protein [Rhodoplanes azumiensis]|uniref:Substrate-binding domain-containing protein n=1 Tax=Rhodoplanes azumiensis TaxID=1897628 RepID=A0ABW5AL54_9BRAD